jgi:hypothetical protein
MFLYWSIHLAIVRQRQQELLAQAERHRIARAALAGGRKGRGRRKIDPAVGDPSATTTAFSPHGAKA